MLFKDVGDTGFTEVAGPRNESQSAAGFRSLATGAANLGSALSAENQKAAAAAQGQLVYDFLGMNLDTSLETSGFDQLDESQVDDIKNQVEGFENHLNQMVEKRGASSYVKAEMLRTLKARSAIAANPAQAKAVIEAAGLADKLSEPLLNAMKEEADFEREIKEDAVTRGFEIADQYGIEYPSSIRGDTDADLWYFNNNPQFQAYQQSQQLKAKAEFEGNAADADKMDRTLGIGISVGDVGLGLYAQAQALKGAEGSASEKALALRTLGEQEKARLLATYPLASPEDIAVINSRIDASVNVAEEFLTDKVTVEQMRLQGTILTQMGQGLSNQQAQHRLFISETFGVEQARATLASTQVRIADSAMQIARNRAQLDSNFTLKEAVNNTTGLRAIVDQSTAAALQGLGDYFQGNISQLPQGAARSTAYLGTLSQLGHINAAGAAGTGPQLAQNEVIDQLPTDLASSLALMRRQRTDPQGYRQIVNALTTELATNDGLLDMIEDNVVDMAPLADSVGDEIQNRMIEGLMGISNDVNTAYKSGIYNPTGTQKLANLFGNAFSQLGTGVMDTIAAIAPEGSDTHKAAVAEAEARRARLKSAITTLAENPTQQNFYNNVGEFMVVDEEALRDQGIFRFKTNDNLSLLGDEIAVREFERRISRVNQRHSQGLTEGAEALRRARGYKNIFDAYNEVVLQGNLGNFVPQDSLLGTEFGVEE